MPADAGAVTPTDLVLQADQTDPISPDLFGSCFQDLNYAAGGLYAALIRHRSLTYAATDHPAWSFLTGSEGKALGGPRARAPRTANRARSNNPRSRELQLNGRPRATEIPATPKVTYDVPAPSRTVIPVKPAAPRRSAGRGVARESDRPSPSWQSHRPSEARAPIE